MYVNGQSVNHFCTLSLCQSLHKLNVEKRAPRKPSWSPAPAFVPSIHTLLKSSNVLTSATQHCASKKVYSPGRAASADHMQDERGKHPISARADLQRTSRLWQGFIFLQASTFCLLVLPFHARCGTGTADRANTCNDQCISSYLQGSRFFPQGELG